MPTASCPLCEGSVFVDANTDLGDFLTCDECDQNLELVGLDPIELDPAVAPPEEAGAEFDLFNNEDD